VSETNRGPIGSEAGRRALFGSRQFAPIQPLSPFAELLAEWDQGGGPHYQRLAARLRAGIRDGQLVGGMRLPPERQLAAHLGVGRSTVVRAYAELELAGLLHRRQGSGTVVAASTRIYSTQPSELSSLISRNVVVRLVAESRDGAIDFLSGHAMQDPAVDAIMARALAAAAPTEEFGASGYYPLGFPPLRAALAAHLTHEGLRTSEDQILVTSGAQQAIALIALGLIRDRRNVVVEDPTFPGAIDSFRVGGARLLPIPMTEAGLDVEELAVLLEDTEVALAYIMPSNHNPTGTVMPAGARAELAQLAEATGVVLVEDNALADLDLTGSRPKPIAALTRAGIVLSIGSLSKVFWGGFRIGWLRGPREMVAHLGQVKATADLGTSVLSQVVAVRLLDHIDEVRRLRRAQVQESLDRLEHLLSTHLPEWRWTRPSGGLSLWAQLPYGSSSELARLAHRHGVSIAPGAVMSARGGFDDYVRLPLGRSGKTMALGVERLAAAWREYIDSTPKAASRLGIVI
jgi:DNA-binding transcriptional MocR family regulator